MIKLAISFGLIGLLISCKEQISNKYNNYKIEGVDRHGQMRVCFNDPDTVCAGIADLAEEEYAQNCKDAGNKVHSCGCYEYVCEQKTYQGLDINGQTKTCTEMSPATICSMEFTDGDQFAIDCNNDGGQAVQCGCHEFICHYSDFITEPKPDSRADLVIQYHGTNQDGEIKTCTPRSDSICEAKINRSHIYAQNCKEEGHEVGWCNCNEVLCLDQ